MNHPHYPYDVFEVFGIECEYMLIEDENLQVAPVSDWCLNIHNENDPVSWSNEFVCHVVELKCSPPHSQLELMEKHFSFAIKEMNKTLANHPGGKKKLMPTAMHPTMDPLIETVLWPHESAEIYDTYHRIFNAKGHGWSNVQSIHINLPFKNETQWSRLLKSIRPVLPLVPYLCASSPFVEGLENGILDNRLVYYERNQMRVPSIIGNIIPAALTSFQAYEKRLEGIYRDLDFLDTHKVISHPWVNSEGAISKLDLGAIEIRLMDIQECPRMDFSLISFLVHLIKKIYYSTHPLTLSDEVCREVYNQTVGYNKAGVLPKEYTQFFKSIFPLTQEVKTLSQLLPLLLDQVAHQMPIEYKNGIELILTQGNLAQRMVTFHRQHQDLQLLYEKLCQHLASNQPFDLTSH